MTTTDTTTHSPTPWRLDSSIGIIYDPSGNMALQYLEEPEHPITEANATHIVRCVNLHDELVRELETLLALCGDLRAIASGGRRDYDLPPMKKARASVAKAKGGAR